MKTTRLDALVAAARRSRHPGRASRHQAVGRRTPTDRHRPCVAAPSPAAPARRGDLAARRGQRGGAAGRGRGCRPYERVVVIAHRLSTVVAADRILSSTRAGSAPRAPTANWSRATRSTPSWPRRSSPREARGCPDPDRVPALPCAARRRVGGEVETMLGRRCIGALAATALIASLPAVAEASPALRVKDGKAQRINDRLLPPRLADRSACGATRKRRSRAARGGPTPRRSLRRSGRPTTAPWPTRGACATGSLRRPRAPS